MRIHRRKFLRLASGGGIFCTICRGAQAESYPTRPARIICGFPSGGAADIAARVAARWFSDRLGESFFVENRPGAATNIATEAVVKAEADGYTLLLLTTTNAVNASYSDNLKFDFLRDLAAVAGIVRVPNVMVINPSFPTNTLTEFIAYAKANPGKINMGSGGAGTAAHMAGELFQMMADVRLTHVPYHGTAPALADLMRGEIQVIFDALSSSIGFINANKIRALAVGTASRTDILPGVPTVAETVNGYEASAWQGISAPRGTPYEIITILNAAMNAAFANAQFRAKLTEIGGIPLAGSPAQFSEFIANETNKWSTVVRFAGVKSG